MCGIVGIFRPEGSEVTRGELEPMLDQIRYRGPDDSGLYVDGCVGLGHVRLSIQDLSSLAAQPMVSHCNRYVLAYNGEIYNVRQLQHELHEHGMALKSTGDTEALLEYIAAFGIETTFDKVEGMFAFALWDKQQQRLIMARDRHGIKPLYYRFGPKGEVHFASEMKVLAGKNPEPDLCTLNATLLGLGGTWGDPTVFRHVKHVCAGEWLVFRHGKEMRRKVFFHVNDFVNEELNRELKGLKKDEIVQRVYDDLNTSTEKRLISDAPVAALVSGGVDSSLIATMASQKYKNLSLYHANVMSESETSAARYLAKSLGLELHMVDVSDEDILDHTPIATYHYEAPVFYHNGSCVPFYMVSKLCGQDGIKVVLTGEGSDEYFLGYPIYAIRPYVLRYEKMLRFFQNLLHRIPRLGNLLWPRKENDHAEQLRHLMFRYELQERRGEAAKRLSFVRNKTEQDWGVMCLDMVIGNVRTLLQRNDRLAMAWGLESRFPFLGHDIARTAVNLPSKYKIRKVPRVSDWRHIFISDKWVVRAIADRYLSHALAHRGKFGFQSSVYRRLQVDKQFFKNGFLEEYYGLNQKAVGHLLEFATPRWLGMVFSLEIWGNVFPLGRTVDQTREQIRRHVRIYPLTS